MPSDALRVLLTNDDGPPGPDSPYIYGLYKHLVNVLGWDVKVVIPSTQKSWIGKAYHIKDTIRGKYYYPRDPDGLGEITEASRPLKEGEIAEWILLDGTPATCTNVALHNLYPGQIDLVLSGPNLGRNTSAAFALSSGTIGAALSSALSGTRSIALSYGTVVRPTPIAWFEPAHTLSLRIIRYLWDNWGKDEGGLRNSEVDLYNVNIPMIAGLLDDEGLKICWTTIWRNAYGRLFEALPDTQTATLTKEVPDAGPDALNAPTSTGTAVASARPGSLVFKFSPEMKGLITPDEHTLPEGSDGWAILKGFVSVTPLRASYAEPPVGVRIAGENEGSDTIIWKMKL
ncbi:sure-like protein [Dentipellis sp. KUC8613]|nr:sure-like protein [Dentipellis sp. KUC8613]